MRRLPAALITALLTLPVAPAEASRPPGDTFEITVRPDGQPASGAPEVCQSNLACGATADISADGRYVAFSTPFSDILPGDTNGALDVFVRDTRTGVTELVSVTPDGDFANDTSAQPSISDDGRFVAFMSLATNLTAEDGPGIDVFVRDRVLGATTLESYGPGDQLAGFQGIDDAVISGDGRFLVFQSGAFDDDRTNDPQLPFGGINFLNVYRRDLVAGSTEMVSLTHTGEQSLSVDITLDESAISRDGSVIAFGSQRHDLVPGDTNAQSDIFVADLNAGTIERVSVASDGTQANWISYRPSLSADGRFVSFSSAANNLVPVDTTSSRVPVGSVLSGAAAPDVFVHDRETGRTDRVSLTSTGLEPGDAYFNDISDDGRFVAFSSPQGSYDGTDLEYSDRVWIHDRETGQTDLVSMTSDGDAMRSAFAATMRISGDGSRIVFAGPSASSPFDDAVYVHHRHPQLAATKVSIHHVGSTADLVGALRLPGVELIDVPVAAVAPVGPSATSVRGVFRPELDDVLIQIGMAGLPKLGAPVPAGPYLGPSRRPMAPAGFAFRVFGEGLVLHVTPTVSSTGDGTFQAEICDVGCSSTFAIEGSAGVAGDEIRFSIPADALRIGAISRIELNSNLSQAFASSIEVSFELPEISASIRAADGPSYPVQLEVSDRTSFQASLPAQPEDTLTLTVCILECIDLDLR